MILLSSWIHIYLTFVWVHSWNQTICIKQGVSDLPFPQLSSCHDVPPHFSSVKAGRQQMWVRWQEFVRVVHFLHLTELSSSSLLNCNTSPENISCGCCVATPVRLFDQQPLYWSYNDSTTLTYLIFHWQQTQTKHHDSVLSLLKQLCVSPSLLYYITIHVLHQWLYLILLISLNMLLISARS